MILLLLFAVVAGAGTAISPCVIPVLPALLSAGATGGRRRPLGIVIGLTITFVIAVALLASLVKGIGLSGGAVRIFAVVVLVFFGIALLVPGLADRVEAPLSRLSRFGPKSSGDGFWSGIAVGGALGFVYAPCAGPILAAVISVSASQGASAQVVAIALAYGLGSAAVLLVLAFGGRKLAERIRRAGRGATLQRALGVVLLLTAVAVSFNLDVRFQTLIADRLPAVVVNPTKALEDSPAVKEGLAGLRGESRFDSEGATASDLPVLGPAPEFRETGRWFNSDPLTIAGQRGEVTLIDFWTYTCINCIRTLPELKAWDAKYRDDGLTIVGVHTPEFAFERSAANVQQAITQNEIRYPVVQDNEYGTWDAWGNHFWPAKYLIDVEGNVRYTHFGEGAVEETEAAIRSLLEEAGARDLGGMSGAAPEEAAPGVETPETYLGLSRAQGYAPHNAPDPGVSDYPAAPRDLPDNTFALSGSWDLAPESATAGNGAAVDATTISKKVFLVLSPPRDGGTGSARILLDGKPITPADAGADVKDGVAQVESQRLYELVSLDGVERHRLRVEPAPGTSAFAFTFG
jgi:cytochrome c biogenesis protein CcdA/thiol-disulfide isomerase/thioredoxin